MSVNASGVTNSVTPAALTDARADLLCKLSFYSILPKSK